MDIAVMGFVFPQNILLFTDSITKQYRGDPDLLNLIDFAYLNSNAVD